MLRLLATAALSMSLLSACAGSSTPDPQPAAAPDKANWTVMVYISGDNNLEKYVVKDLEDELSAVGSSADVQIVALADRGPGFDTSRGDWQSTKLFHVTQGMHADAESAVADWGERDFGDKQTLIDFASWTKANYPADHYALYFWGHGWSWHPGWVMKDETSNDALDYDETKAALPLLGKVGVVGYDGCNMASLEIMNLWQAHAAAVTGSQEWVGWDGLEYDEFLGELAANPAMSADELAVASSRSTVTDKTWSAVAADHRIVSLVSAVDRWAKALRAGLATNKRAYDQAFDAAQTFWEAPVDRDLYDVVVQVDKRVSDPNIHAAGRAVLLAFDAAVLHEHHAANYDGAHGITIYLPQSAKRLRDFAYFRTLDLAHQTSWDEFLVAYSRTFSPRPAGQVS